MRDKLEVIERGADLVLAAHHTRVAPGLTVTTVETVRFERPHRISFRLVKGPVPHVLERYELLPSDGGTAFEYRGELGTDLWALGSAVGCRRRAVLGADRRDHPRRRPHRGRAPRAPATVTPRIRPRLGPRGHLSVTIGSVVRRQAVARRRLRSAVARSR